MSTHYLVAELFTHNRVLVSHQIEQRIDWPDPETMSRNRHWGGKSKEQLLDHAVRLIDIGDSRALAEAREALERLLTQDPRYAAGHVEMARVAMKANWGPEGLHQAETYLLSALQMQPDSVNAKILLGYVRTHQQRYKEAEKLFVEASGTATRNLWLWANWGELLEMQRKVDLAQEKYRLTISAPRSDDGAAM